MKGFLKEKSGTGPLMRWQTWVIIGLVVVLVAAYFGYINIPGITPESEIGFNTYVMLENGDNIKVTEEYTMTFDALGMYTPSGQRITSIWQNLWIKPTWSESEATGNATITYVSHRITWQKIPSGASTNQVSPTWYLFSSFTAPLNQKTEKNYGPHWNSSQFYSPSVPVPDGEYWVNTWLTVKGEYGGKSTTKEVAGGLHITKTSGTLTIETGWQGYTSFILG